MKKKILRLISFCVIAFFLFGCGKRVIGPVPGVNLSSGSAALRHSVVKTARAQIGKPYRWGGASPGRGFDCSGLVWWVYRRHGIDVPRVSWQQKYAGRAVPESSIKAGDIVLFKVPGQGKSLHTGVYSGNGYSFIHSPKSGSVVREESMKNNYWRKYYIGARRIIQ
ncbi:C40 family peptidase [Maridesulfovibrio sp.]|uniref:C40 family peptidase n=1 Tax=Maridesulfovibrio sp. TaxID=2795000 RepID=UPI0029CA4D76|nr:C40 family peptidase [Maridesulfovibrio sp.]